MDAINEIKDAVCSRFKTRDERGPRDRTLRRHRSSKAAEAALISQTRKVG